MVRLTSDGGFRANLARGMFLAQKWYKTGAAFAFTGAVVALYVMDWKVVTNKIPFYKNKYQEQN